MAEARGALEWGQTSQVLAMFFNAWRDGKSTSVAKPEDFNPYASRENAELPPIPAKMANKLMMQRAGKKSDGKQGRKSSG